jgi:hypothetical protein
MPEISITDMTLRTTSCEAGYPHTVVTGCGLVPIEALADLAVAAEREAERIAGQFRTAEYDARPDAEWPFEVVDIRFVAGPVGSSRCEWLVYGTLVSAGVTPWAMARSRSVHPGLAHDPDPSERPLPPRRPR